MKVEHNFIRSGCFIYRKRDIYLQPVSFVDTHHYTTAHIEVHVSGPVHVASTHTEHTYPLLQSVYSAGDSWNASRMLNTSQDVAYRAGYMHSPCTLSLVRILPNLYYLSCSSIGF